MQGFYGYGSFGQTDPAAQAAQACANLNGNWNPESYECTVWGQVIQLPDMQPSALPPAPSVPAPTSPTDDCGPDMVMTPSGCKPFPGGVTDCPKGTVMTPQGCQAAQPGQPVPAKTGTPSWVLPAVIGVGVVAVAAVVMSTGRR